MNERILPPQSVSDIAKVQQKDDTPGFTGGMASADDMHFIELLRRGDEAAFMSLIEQYHASMLRLAQIFVSTRPLAEEVVQEAWLGVLQGLKRFEGRSSLKTWIFRILTNCAKTRAQREGRSIPFSALSDFDPDHNEPAVDPEFFFASDHPDSPDRWISLPKNWDEMPEDRLLSEETSGQIRQAIALLPAGQREVITLRDIEGWSAPEVCNFLAISETNQRVLLHRARSRVRQVLEQYFGEGRRA
jgi:RNA polymerase sigma-70 factor (ECF subfamily)